MVGGRREQRQEAGAHERLKVESDRQPGPVPLWGKVVGVQVGETKRLGRQGELRGVEESRSPSTGGLGDSCTQLARPKHPHWPDSKIP